MSSSSVSRDGGGDTSLLARIVNGGNVRWGLLATTIFGGALLAFLEGVTAFTLDLLGLPGFILGGIGDFLSAGITAVFGALQLAARGSFVEAAATAQTGGVAAFAVGVAVVTATVWLVQEVLARA